MFCQTPDARRPTSYVSMINLTKLWTGIAQPADELRFGCRGNNAGTAPAVAPSEIPLAASGRAEREVVVAAWECGRVKRPEVLADAVESE